MYKYLIIGIILGLCSAGFILLLVRDLIIKYFLSEVQILDNNSIKTDPSFIEKAEIATVRYAHVLVEARNALDILITCTDTSEPDSKAFVDSLKRQLTHMDEELDSLVKLGIVKRNDKDETN